jgi:nucleoside-diphosphate-sugar epimerase
VAIHQKRKKMRTLITGGTGFIGAEVARALIGRGSTGITLFDVHDSRRRLEDIGDRVTIVKGDVGILSHVLDAVRSSRAEIIYHLGAMLSVPSEQDPPAAFHANAIGTFHIFEAARLFDVKRVVFASSTATFGYDLPAGPIDGRSLQRPQTFYGACKLFGENMGRFYRRKYGIDYRGVRYPSIVGPGVRSPGSVQYTSWVIEHAAKGIPFTIWVRPETRVPILYFKDAALAILALAEAPPERIKMVNYLLSGPRPTALELVNLVKQRFPGAQINFEVDDEIQLRMDNAMRPLDDRFAREEWGWKPTYGVDAMIDDFLAELSQYPHRYA